MSIEQILHLLSFFSIVHHSKGRIRLRASLKLKQEIEKLSNPNNFTLNDVENLPSKIKGIENVKINKLLGSVTILYNDLIFPSSLWEDIIKNKDKSKLETIIASIKKEYNATA